MSRRSASGFYVERESWPWPRIRCRDRRTTAGRSGVSIFVMRHTRNGFAI